MPTTVKVDDNEAQLLREVRDKMLREGIAPLEKMNPICPKCNNKLSGITITAEHWECPKCGYSQDGFSIGAGGMVALGAVIGAGVTALLWWLSSQKDEEE